MLSILGINPLWESLKNADKPILLYGMGNGADMIIKVLESYGIDYEDTFASDGFVRGHSFHGKRVLSFSEAKEKYGDFIIIVTFAVHDDKTMSYEFLENGACKITYADVTIPIINITYDGTVDGTYSVAKDDAGNYHVTVIYTILSKSVTKDYTFSVDGNALTLTDTADGTTTTLMAYTDPATVSTSAAQ